MAPKKRTVRCGFGIKRGAARILGRGVWGDVGAVSGGKIKPAGAPLGGKSGLGPGLPRPFPPKARGAVPLCRRAGTAGRRAPFSQFKAFAPKNWRAVGPKSSVLSIALCTANRYNQTCKQQRRCGSPPDSQRRFRYEAVCLWTFHPAAFLR